MDGGGIAETGRGAHIVSRKPDGQLAAVMPDGEVTAPADAGDGPPVAVFHPVRGCQPEPSVVSAGNDHISDTRLIAVAQTHLQRRGGVVEAIITGAAVEFGDKLAGGGEHDRIESSRSVRKPTSEGILGGFRDVADVDALMSEVEVERLRFAFAEGE